MTAEPARQALADAVSGGATSLDNIAIRGASLAEAEVSRFDLVANMATGVIGDVLKALNRLTLKQFLNYDPSYQTSTSQVLVENLAEIPNLPRSTQRFEPAMSSMTQVDHRSSRWPTSSEPGRTKRSPTA